MAILKKLYPILLPLFLTGCYEDFDPHIDTTPVLCLNSLITAGSPIDVKVTRSWTYTEVTGESDHSVTDATVSIYANGIPVDSGYVAEEGDRIRIHAVSPSYGEAEAEVTVPVSPRISDTDFSTVVTDLRMQNYQGWGLNADIWFDIRISMEFADIRETDDYHRLTYTTFSPKGIMSGEEDPELPLRPVHYAHLSGGNFDALDPVFYEQVDPFEDMMYGSYYYTFFSDRLYNGEKKTLTFGFSTCFFDLSGWHGDPNDLECGWEVTLYSISESYYKWLAYIEHDNGIIFNDFSYLGMADPIWSYSNVSTGAGVVAAESSVKVKINIKDFLMKIIDAALAGN
ncbi:MAG: DUF4249 domain-containing protein [Muribaculaceae bacterium]|nr:DUF4249 domain-containing protein [Muribaculaceae bacterium]